MNTKLTKSLGRAALMLLVITWISPGVWAEDGQAEDAKAYQAAQRLVLEEEWGRAAKALAAFLSA